MNRKKLFTSSSQHPPRPSAKGVRECTVYEVPLLRTLAARALRLPSCLADARSLRRVRNASNDCSSSVILRGASWT